jgi:ribonuclease E
MEGDRRESRSEEDRQEAAPVEREARSGRERSVYATRDAAAAPSPSPVDASAGDGQEAPVIEERAPRREAQGEGRRERRPDGGASRRADGAGAEREERAGAEREERTGAPSTSQEGGFVERGSETQVGTPDGTEQAPRRDSEDRRGRSRDRYGRDRRPRGDAGEATTEDVSAAADVVPSEEPAGTSKAEPVSPEAPMLARMEARTDLDQGDHQKQPENFVSFGNAPQVDAPTEKSPSRTGPAGSPPSEQRPDEPKSEPAAGSLPRIQPFELPLASLAQVAESSGLQWVHSNPERIAEVRAAIAAEPVALHVARQRPPAAVIEEGPLVLVETRRDLSRTVLPFERTTDSQGASLG